MSIVILILKIIGIIVLVLLALILFLLGIVLFCPVRYVVLANTKQLDYHVSFKITWLLFIIRFCGTLQNEKLIYSVKIFGHSFLVDPTTTKQKKDSTNRNKKHKKNKKNKKSKKYKKSKYSDTSKKNTKAKSDEEKNDSILLLKDNADSINHKKQDISKVEMQQQKQQKQDKYQKQEKQQQKQEKQKQQKRESGQDKKSGFEEFFKKKQRLFQKAKSVCHGLKEAFLHAKDKVVFLKEKQEEIKRQIADEKNRKAVRHLWKEIKYLLHHFKPRKIKADAVFSTTDPALTGQLTGLLCLFPFLFNYEVHIIPDFEADSYQFQGHLMIKGHIHLIHALCTAIRVLLDKNIMKWIKRKL